jgi:hypothetical protein
VNRERDLTTLATLIRRRNAVDREIADVIGRPGSSANIGAYIAAKIFDIDLGPASVSAGFNGQFREGPLAGSTVNIKLYAESGSFLLDISPLPGDYYLVLTGPVPVKPAGPRILPVRIEHIYLFERRSLLQDHGVRMGMASTVRKQLWDAAEIYPSHPSSPLQITEDQAALIALFHPENGET